MPVPHDLLDNFIEKKKIDDFHSYLEENDRFLLTTHVHPDGDGLGSEIGLYYALKDLGKEVRILNHNLAPRQYDFLDQDGIIEIFDPSIHRTYLENVQVCVVLDVGEWNRLRQLGADLKSTEIPIICIDHHPSDASLGDFNIIYPNASSTGEIVFLLLTALNVPFTRPISTGLYTAIVTDTGSFRYTNTTENSHKMAGYLIGKGVDHIQVYQKVYEREPIGKIRLLADLLSHLNFECDSKVVWCAITRDMLKTYGLEPNETEGLSDFSRRIDGVEISILFLEIDDSLTKISFRSNGSISIKDLAGIFGGGGHAYASGALVNRPLYEVIGQFRQEIEHYYQANFPG